MRVYAFFLLFQSFAIPVIALAAGGILWIASTATEYQSDWLAKSAIVAEFDSERCSTTRGEKIIVVRCLRETN